MEDYYSTKQIADILNVSKQRVYRCIRNNCIKEAHQEVIKGNTVMMYDESALNQIKELLTGVSSNTYHDVSNNVSNDVLCDTLMKQIETLLKQLDRKDEQIKMLNDRLKDMQMVLSQEQKLHLLNANQGTLEFEKTVDKTNSDESDQEQVQPKKRWRFFRKKRGVEK